MACGDVVRRQGQRRWAGVAAQRDRRDGDQVLGERGRLVFRGSIADVEAAATRAGNTAASAVERGYTALLREFRSRR